MGYITLLIVKDHEQYNNRKAIIVEKDKNTEVVIVRTNRNSATVQHKDNQLQKVLWGRLLVEQRQ